MCSEGGAQIRARQPPVNQLCVSKFEWTYSAWPNRVSLDLDPDKLAHDEGQLRKTAAAALVGGTIIVTAPVG